MTLSLVFSASDRLLDVLYAAVLAMIEQVCNLPFITFLLLFIIIIIIARFIGNF